MDAYTKVLQPTAAQRTYVESGRDRQQTLERCVHRWEFDREKKAKKEATLAAADADRVAFRSIDWHDFVVVEVTLTVHICFVPSNPPPPSSSFRNYSSTSFLGFLFVIWRLRGERGGQGRATNEQTNGGWADRVVVAPYMLGMLSTAFVVDGPLKNLRRGT